MLSMVSEEVLTAGCDISRSSLDECVALAQKSQLQGEVTRRSGGFWCLFSPGVHRAQGVQVQTVMVSLRPSHQLDRVFSVERLCVASSKCLDAHTI